MTPGAAAAEFTGKISPVHYFWHTFDIAVTRFSDRRIEQLAEVDSVTREAYSHEVISSSFWFGDESYPTAAFYSYTAPEPAGLASEPLEPYAARWVERGPSHLAVLDYDAARATCDVRAAVLTFYRSAYLAGARRAGWDIEALTYRAP